MTTETFAKPTELEAELAAMTTCRCAMEDLTADQRERVTGWLATWHHQSQRRTPPDGLMSNPNSAAQSRY